jgi:RNA polymerase sigma-70 factor, ECF subfamily
MQMQSPIGITAGETDDEILIQRLRQGDLAAGELLVQRYCRDLLQYLRRLVGNDHLAEELHQQTWVSVLEHIDRFDAAGKGEAGGSGSGGFRPWLFRIATNKANDQWRSRGREKNAMSGLRLVTDDIVPHAGHRIEETEEQVRLKKAIDQLPDNQKQVLLLKYYSNLKFVEIAQILGCPLNTALGRMHKAILKLKELMSDEQVRPHGREGKVG